MFNNLDTEIKAEERIRILFHNAASLGSRRERVAHRQHSNGLRDHMARETMVASNGEVPAPTFTPKINRIMIEVLCTKSMDRSQY